MTADNSTVIDDELIDKRDNCCSTLKPQLRMEMVAKAAANKEALRSLVVEETYLEYGKLYCNYNENLYMKIPIELANYVTNKNPEYYEYTQEDDLKLILLTKTIYDSATFGKLWLSVLLSSGYNTVL